MAKNIKKRVEVNVSPLLRKLEAITLDLIDTPLLGSYRSIFKGVGLEFDSYKSYNSSDDAGSIDWKASSRARQLLVKTYVEERELNVLFLVDISNSMLFSSIKKLKNEYAIELIASLSYAILESGDNVGIALFNDDVIKQIYPTKGRTQFYAIIKELLDPNIYGGGIDLEKAIDFVLGYLKGGSGLVIIVSDFFGLRGDWVKKLRYLGAKFEVVGMMVRDPRDRTLPDDVGEVMIQDPYSKKSMLIDPKILKKKYEDYVKKQEKELKETFMKCRADFISLSTDESFIKYLLAFFRRRKAKWI
ncbi:MAG: DUF58 domain-containing protein [Nanoarchaeota archaeon]|nr:DUF58 domain-containing protein [Nanoarchaeota archaeon]